MGMMNLALRCGLDWLVYDFMFILVGNSFDSSHLATNGNVNGSTKEQVR